MRGLGIVIARALVLSDGRTLQPADLPPTLSGRAAMKTSADGDLSIKRQTELLERTLIQRALERTKGNRTRAAELLDLSHRALLYKIREYGLDEVFEKRDASRVTGHA